MPCVEELAWSVADLSALKISALNACKQYSAPSDFGAAGIEPAVAATILAGFATTSRSVKLFRGGQRRRCAILFAELGAGMPYRAASRVLKTCGFDQMRASHMAIRRHTLAIGRELEAHRLDVASGQAVQTPGAAKSLVVGIDDTYVKHRERLVARQFQVTAGRVERNGKLGARFVFVSSNPGWTESFFDGFLLQQGMKRNTVMGVVMDGDDGLRNFVQRTSPRPMESQLDWFHIGMRLELLRKAVVMPVTYQEYLEDPDTFGPMQRRVSRLRSALWRGRSWQALLQFAWLRGDIDRWAAEHPGRCAQSVRRAKQVIKEFRYYVCGNRRSLPDFAKQ